MKIYTKTGDKGETGLYGGERVPKNALRVSAYGSIDEANAALGLARSHLLDAHVNADLSLVQNVLFDVGADLATPVASKYRENITPIVAKDVSELEALIDRYDAELSQLRNFILPGGHPAAAALHLARSIVRRAEREVVALAEQEDINAQLVIYLNRLSDLLFTLARTVNMHMGVSEVNWYVKKRDAS